MLHLNVLISTLIETICKVRGASNSQLHWWRRYVGSIGNAVVDYVT